MMVTSFAAHEETRRILNESQTTKKREILAQNKEIYNSPVSL